MMRPAAGHSLRHKLWHRLKDQSFAEQMLADERLRRQEERERHEILAILPPFAGQRVVDIGAGVGRFTAEFAPRATHVTAVDLLEHSLRKNRERNAAHRNIDYVCSDAMALTQAPGSADLIFSNWLLMYLGEEEIRTLLRRCREWLAPGGRVFFKESCETNVFGYGPFRIGVIGVVQKYTGITINRHVSTAPTWREIWCWLTRQRGQQSIYYRKAAEYERLFAEDFNVVQRGSLAVFLELYNNPNQRYWLLAPKGT